MASVPYDVIAASKPFRFLVGPDKKEFLMHAELVGRLSKPLWTLVNGDWQEGKTGLAEWPEIDEGTFVRFCEFAYTGDYKAAESTIEVPTPETLENVGSGDATTSETVVEETEAQLATNFEDVDMHASPAPEPEPARAEPFGGIFAKSSSIKAKKKKVPSPYTWAEDDLPPEPLQPSPSKGNTLWKEFKRGVSDTELDKRHKELANEDPMENFSEVLLSHARLYALADCYDISELMELCLRKLQRTLRVFKFHGGARVTDIAQLLDYSFKNTQDKATGKDQLRSLLATYVACRIEVLWPNIYFQDVLESSGEVSKAIVGQLLRRVN
ncbi:uncharacterized protein F4822DRAFT_411175 [Hypoxylon trugodes]|uniref:uncharacterized protein n=1 Tax=Hypoxylon trugodes TaxID=326681 RepID=UPI0021A21BB9|nr:uncharacterized protein F4822DRAFT_411175 [Hypoxylon trugodes]KAI1386772.1 hypothetical protein F4822DRAFT_411175 [Hypoxylon trugodes]